MDLDVNSNLGKSTGIHKKLFQLKSSRRDGLVLQIHHTVPAANGEIHRVRFVHLAFDENGEQLAAADHRGNIFIIDLSSNKFWMLPNLDSSCSVIGFTAYKRNEILVGIKDCTLNFVNTELGTVTGKLTGHTVSPTQISFSSDHRFCLSASSEEGIIWDLKSNSQAHQLAMHAGMAVKRVVFMPISNNILACFQDDTMHVWKFESLQCLKQIIPEAWKSHNLKTLAFTKDGRAMVIGGHTSSLVVFALDNWTVKKVIDLSDAMPGVRGIDFLPQVFDGGANKILCLLATNCTTIRFLDIETSTFLQSAIEPDGTITKFACSNNGKYIACILHSGEVNIYNSAKIFETSHPRPSSSLSDVPFPTEKAESVKLCTSSNMTEQRETRKHHRSKRHASNKHSEHIQTQIKETLDLSRLKPILKEFGEYPASYRPLIWRTILKLPQNQQSYASLVNRGCYPSYSHLEHNYPLENKTVLKNLKRLLSCLAHWSTLFGEVKYLPLFVFPFVKVFQNEPFVCFEAVASIIMNWCQHWFEYFPHPPINVLAMIENVLAEEDPELMTHFYSTGVTSQLYAWTLLENAFSEVLSQVEWLRLWDHILSNDPSFMLMAVVSYNIISRAALKSCHTCDDFEHFFHNQNAIDMKQLISKSYSLCRNTKDDIHPRQYLKDYTPIESGIYPVFNQYPKFIIDDQVQQLEAIRHEEESIINQEQLAMELKVAQERKIREEMQANVQASRMQKLEDTYHQKLQEEEERVANQRDRLTALRRDLRAQEAVLLNTAQDKMTRQHAQQRTITLNRLLANIKRKQTREESQLAATEEDMRGHYTELLTHRHEIDNDLREDAEPAESLTHRELRCQQEKLSQELRMLRNEASSSQHCRHRNIASRISKVDEMLKRVGIEFAREIGDHQTNLDTEREQNNLKALQLECRTKALEKKAEQLLEQLAGTHLEESLAQTDHWDTNHDHHLNGNQYIPSNPCPCSHPTYWDSSGECSGETLKDFKHCDQWTAPSIGTEHRGLGSNSNNCLRSRLPSHKSGYDARPRSPISVSRTHTDISGRNREHYSRERSAVQSAMNVREQILLHRGGSSPHLCRK